MRKIFLTINVPAPLVNFIFRQAMKISSAPLDISPPYIGLSAKFRETFSGSINFPPIIFGLSPLVKRFFHLYDYDSDYLYNMDGEQLQDLDYTIV